MNKWYGKIGFGVTETALHTGIYKDTITERYYYGDIIKNYRRWTSGESVNNNLMISNEISVVADEFAYANASSMRYVEFLGSKWTVDNVTVEAPRLRISIGSVYNGPTPDR